MGRIMGEVESIRRDVRVRCSPDRAFRVFTERIGTWWPLETHSIAVDQELGLRAVTLKIDTREEGRIQEVLEDSSTRDWGGVVAWEPPHRVVFAWKPNDRPIPPTEVEVRFTPEADGALVQLEHRGWDRLGEVSEVIRPLYASDGGWTMVLERYRNAAGSQDPA
jgi:uncharacterized protein YndB with AHSA1/START domain